MKKKKIIVCVVALVVLVSSIAAYAATSTGSNLQNNTGDKYLFVGDSYSGYTQMEDGTYSRSYGWRFQFAEKMNLVEGETYYDACKGGSGFITPNEDYYTYLESVTEVADSLSGSEKNGITKILVLGDWNDVKISTGDIEDDRETLTAAMEEFVDYCTKTFPNATIYMGMIASHRGDDEVAVANRDWFRQVSLFCMQNLDNVTYLTGIEDYMTDTNALISDDCVHLNKAGSDKLVARLATYFTESEFDGIIVCNGQNFPDALCASSLEDATGFPLIMVSATDTDESQIVDRVSATATVYIIGGPNVVSQQLENNLRDQSKYGFSVKRLYGETRFDTNQAVLDEVALIEGNQE